MSNNERKDHHRGFQIVILVFAIIGMISVLGLSVIGIFAVKEYFSKDRETEITEASAEPDEISDKTEEITAEPTPENEESENTVSSLVSELKEAALPEPETQNVDDIMEYGNGRLTITIFGDSILDNFRDETGIANRMSADLDATVFNLAIGGTCATVEPDAQLENERWDCTCGLGMVKALAGEVELDALRDCTATQILRDHMDEIRNTDVFIIEYGINDFLSVKPLSSDDYRSGLTTYVGSMREMVRILQPFLVRSSYLTLSTCI